LGFVFRVMVSMLRKKGGFYRPHPFGKLRVHPEGFSLKGKLLAPSPNRDNEECQENLFGEGEEI
jgi:hypothetical protein